MINRRQLRLKRKKRVNVSKTIGRPRITVYKSNQALYLQLIDDFESKTLAQSSSIKEKKINTEIAKKIGLDFAKKVLDLKITQCVFDRNGYLYTGVIQVVADAIREGGVQI